MREKIENTLKAILKHVGQCGSCYGTSGFLSWEPSKKTKRAFYDVGCTLDWVQRSRNRQKGVKDDDDDDDFDDDRYPLDLNDESF